MRRFLLSAAALVIGLAVVGTAEAGPKGGGGGSKGSSYSSHSSHSMYNSHSSSNYHTNYGSKYNGSHSYKSKDYHEWSHQCWWGKYGCYTYYCPSSCCWYYWYPQDCCYYPCSYVSYATPVCQSCPSGVQSGVTQVVNVTNNSPGGGPAAGPGFAGPGPAGPAVAGATPPGPPR